MWYDENKKPKKTSKQTGGITEMSVEFWNSAERFYELWFIVLGVIAFLFLMTILFVWMYARKEKRKRYTLISLLGIGAVAAIGVGGHLKYQPYLEEASHVNPLIRDREPTMTGYVYYGQYERNFFSQLNDLESLRDMSLYEEERVTEPVTYLGAGDYFHYFERSNGEVFKQNRLVEFIEESTQAQLVGSRFQLRDDAFQEIGFQNPKNVMFEYIEVPASEEGKTYEPEYDPAIPTAEERFHQWNF